MILSPKDICNVWTFLDVSTSGRCYWQLMGRDTDAAKHPTVPRTPPTTKNYLAPNVDGTEKEKNLVYLRQILPVLFFYISVLHLRFCKLCMALTGYNPGKREDRSIWGIFLVVLRR